MKFWKKNTKTKRIKNGKQAMLKAKKMSKGMIWIVKPLILDIMTNSTFSIVF
jgi:hypothetical protein